MNKKITIGIAVLMTALMVFLPLAHSAAHAETPATFAATSKAAVMLDSKTGTVVFEKNVKEHLQIASMVKIMTLSIAFDEIEKRGIALDTLVTASDNAASMGGSQAFLDANAQYRLDELLKSIIVASANDSCVAVAEYLCGSVDEFVSVMNARAAEWGMNDTRFVNCTGLPKDGQYSCASDVAVMFGKLIGHERFFEYAKEWTYDFAHPDGRVTQLTNTNKASPLLRRLRRRQNGLYRRGALVRDGYRKARRYAVCVRGYRRGKLQDAQQRGVRAAQLRICQL